MPTAIQTDRLLDLLERLEPSGDFCTWGTLPMALPGLEVEGVGPVTLPVQPAQARELIRVASQAPFGRGQETVVDTKVRRVWQLEPGQFTLRGPDWTEAVDAAVEAVRDAFAIPEKVQGRLYKLLIYEKDSFFVAHRDTEKLDRMFATLVVCLPSWHAGGALEVTHEGETWSMDLSPDSGFRLQYAAFYADCLHEVKPVESGYRVCLVYNLVRPRGAKAPRANSHVQPVAEALTEVLRTRDKVALPLEHEYTEAGFGWDDLKGRDRVLLQVLQGAAERAGLDLHLALMTLYEVGEADVQDFYQYSRHRISEEEVGLEEVYDQSYALDSWTGPDGRVERLGRLEVLPEEVLLRGGFADLPWQQEVNEATGNEGVSVERTYRGAMAVLWPRDRFLTLLAKQGPNVAIPLLQGRSGPEALAFAAAILDAWPRGRAAAAAEMVPVLVRLADATLARRFLREVLPHARGGSEGPALAKLCAKIGWDAVALDLVAFVAAQEPALGGELGPTLGVLEGMAGKMPAVTAEQVGGELLRVLRLWDLHARERIAWGSAPDRRPTLESIFRILRGSGQLRDLAEHCVTDEARYPVREVLVPSVRALQKAGHHAGAGAEAWRILHARCAERLREWTAEPVVVPDHWALPAKLSCRCKDCREVERFLAHPEERTWRLKAVEFRRRHLEAQVRPLDVDARTERSGSPHTLVLTKNRASYERAQKQFEADRRALLELERLAE